MRFIFDKISAWQINQLAAAPRNKQFIKIPRAQSIGIVFDATDNEVFEAVKKFIGQLKEYNKNIHSIGFVNNNHIPGYSYTKTDIDLLGKKDVNFLQKPNSPYLNTFLNEPKDLLIDINPHALISIRYMVAASKASCKVGRQTHESDLPLHDVLIAAPENESLQFYLQQVIKYLN